MKHCQICEHTVRRQINCGRSELNCEDRYSHFHYHCDQGCNCTYGGCIPIDDEADR